MLKRSVLWSWRPRWDWCGGKPAVERRCLGYPLADSVWVFDVTMLSSEVVAFALAALRGTPGCEIGVWSELIGRAGGRAPAAGDGLACIVGLHFVDRWERRIRRSRLDTKPHV